MLAEQAKALLDHAERVEASVVDEPTATVPLKVSSISSTFAGLVPRVVPGSVPRCPTSASRS
ncbi:hypothetical protein P9139_19915 [Curtobacterium flaccumfaciens]|nr:hypothetical protein P9139_19915 [Curtobacterium flaccumfaciens]